MSNSPLNHIITNGENSENNCLNMVISKSVGINAENSLPPHNKTGFIPRYSMDPSACMINHLQS